jgi:hypothetical protein
LSVKDFFSKIGFIFSCVGAFLVALFLGKKLHGNGKRADRDSDSNRPNDDASKRADRLSEEAGESAKRIFDIIERVKARERETAIESENL